RVGRPWIIQRRSVHNNAGGLRRSVSLSSVLMQVPKIEKDSICGLNDGHTIAFRIPRKARPRSETFPIVGLPGIRVWDPAVALKVDPCRSVGINRADNALIEAGFVEEGALARPIVWRSIGLPSHAAVQREVGGCLPRVLQIQ